MRVSASGSRLAVGCPSEQSETHVGRVDFFADTGDGWLFERSVIAPDGFAGNAFGALVLQTNDRLFVSATNDHQGGVLKAGAVYVFDLAGSTATLRQKLLPSFRGENAQFGLDLALSHDGATLVVGASMENNGSGFSAGAAYVFERNAQGSYVEKVRLVPASTTCTACMYGRSVAARNDMVVISALGASGQFDLEGRVDIYYRTPTGWPTSPSQSISPPDPEDFGTFGQFVSLGGNRLAVNSLRGADPGMVGRLYLFGEDDGGFTLESEVLSLGVSGNSGFGYPCILNEDGTLLAAGAFTDDASSSNSGAVVVFDLSSGAPVETHVLHSNAPQWGESFGASVKLHHGRAWISSPGWDSSTAPDCGAVQGFALYAPADLSHDGLVDGADLTMLMAQWGPATPSTVADLNDDGAVNGGDLSVLLGGWG